MQGPLVTTLVLCCLGGTATATPLQDPANVDAARVSDPANISPRAAPATRASSWMSAFGASPAPRSPRPSPRNDHRAADAMPALSGEDYRQAYGNSDIRARLGRVYGAGSASDALSGGGNGFGWLERMSSDWGTSFGGIANGGGSLSETTQPIRNAMDDISRQLMPALRDMKQDVDAELDRASRDRK